MKERQICLQCNPSHRLWLWGTIVLFSYASQITAKCGSVILGKVKIYHSNNTPNLCPAATKIWSILFSLVSMAWIMLSLVRKLLAGFHRVCMAWGKRNYEGLEGSSFIHYRGVFGKKGIAGPLMARSPFVFWKDLFSFFVWEETCLSPWTLSWMF